jgi:hypothetical protein
MERRESKPRRNPRTPHTAATALVAALASASIGAAGCSSSSKDAGETGGAGNVPGAAGAQDPGVYGACTSKPVVDPAPDLTGRWAARTVMSLYVPQTGLTSAFYTKTVSLLLADVTATGTDIALHAAYCDQSSQDTGSMAHVVIPKTYSQSLKPMDRTGSFAPGSDWVPIFSLPTDVVVVGATLEDPMNDPMPTEASDPRVVDQDNDDHPGITIKLSGTVNGDLYVVQRQVSEFTGVAVSDDRVEGHYGFTSEQIILESNPASLKAVAKNTAVVDPNVCASSFTMVRLAATATCDDITSNATLFD